MQTGRDDDPTIVAQKSLALIPRGPASTLMIDALNAKPLVAMSTVRRLRQRATRAYTIGKTQSEGPDLFREIGFDGSAIMRADVPGFCGTENGFVANWADQTANGRDYTADSNAWPLLYNGVLNFKQNAGGKDAIKFNGADQVLTRADALGLTGSPAITVACVFQFGTLTGFDTVWAVGGTGGGTGRFTQEFNVDLTHSAVWQQASTLRQFSTTGSVTSAARRWLAAKARSALPSTYTLSEDGSALSQSSVSGGSTAMNMVNTASAIGRDTDGTGFADMYMNFFAVWDSELSAADLAIVQTEMGLHV